MRRLKRLRIELSMKQIPKKLLEKAVSNLSTVWKWTGIGKKKGWDLFQLAITTSIPIVIFLGTQNFNKQQQEIAKQNNEQQQEIATSRYQQETLTKYLEQMSQLLLDKNLRQEKSESRTIARARTLSTLRELDSFRKGLLIKFLAEAELISGEKPVISLEDAELGKTELQGVNIPKANLEGANLEGANLEGANLEGANLEGANLEGAILRKANLEGANLEGANLEEAILWKANLGKAKLLGNAYLAGANLAGAYLAGAYLEGANLKGAYLEGAYLAGAKLGKANLEGAKYTDENTKPEVCEQIYLKPPCPTKFPSEFDPIAAKMVLSTKK
jgi:uncharacterized protein YjbI with pentapeptide repeats